VFQARSLEKFETTALVVDGIMYTVQAPNDLVALDAVTGRPYWIYSYRPAPEARLCCGRINRGVAILGDTLFMGTIDGHLVAVDAKNGHAIWDVPLGRPEAGYALTHAPLIIKDKVIVGTAGGEYGIRGFLAAYDAKTGKEAWRFNTIPGPGEPGHDTWGGDSWTHGGGSVWVTGSYDPDLNLTTASDLLFSGGNEGYFFALDARSGALLWKSSVGGAIAAGPMTYAVAGRQYVSVAAGSSLFTYALRQ
jgi:alcohol dehydrogenase (cytochrome c)